MGKKKKSDAFPLPAAVFAVLLIGMFVALGTVPALNLVAGWLPSKTLQFTVEDKETRKSSGGFKTRGASSGGTSYLLTLASPVHDGETVYCQNKVYRRLRIGDEIKLESSVLFGIPKAIVLPAKKKLSVIPEGGILEKAINMGKEDKSPLPPEGERLSLAGMNPWVLAVLAALFLGLGGYIAFKLPGDHRSVKLTKIDGVALGFAAGVLWAGFGI